MKRGDYENIMLSKGNVACIQKKDNDLKNKVNCAVYLPFTVLFLFMIFIHFNIDLGWGDDVYFANIFGEAGPSLEKWWENIVWRYNNWSSRLVIESILYFLAPYPLLWRILDTAMMVWIAVGFSIFFNDDKRMGTNWIIVLSIMCFPFESMSTAGWIATSVNYLWPLAAGLVVLVPLNNIIKKKNTSNIIKIIAFLATFLATNQEQMCFIICALYAFFLCYLFLKKEKINFFLKLEAVVCILNLFFILTCPGNQVRKVSEIETWFPSYTQLSFLRKVEMGYSSSLYEFFMKLNLVFVLFAVILVLVVYLNKSKYNKIYFALSMVSLVTSVIMGLLYNITKDIFPFITSLSQKMTDIGTGISISNLTSWIPDMFITGVFFCIIICLGICFMNKSKSIFACYILFIGLLSRWIMGFSPTIWASNTRTFIFMYFSFIALIVILFDELEKRNGLKKKNIKIILEIGITIIGFYLLEHQLYFINTF